MIHLILPTNKFIPNEFHNDFYSIDFKSLYASGKRLILTDLDNTLISYEESEPNKQIDDKFVYGENVGQVNHYIFSQSIQAAITATSARYAKELQGLGNWKPVSKEYLIDQSACIIKDTTKFTEAGIFLDFVLSPEGQSILLKFGYLSPN